MLHRIATVALNAYRESVRARVLLGLAGVGFAVALYSLVVGAYTLRDAPRTVADLGAAGLSIFSIVVAVAISATTLHRELEQKTVLPILARPIRRSEYLVGKYLGTIVVVAVFIVADAGLVLMMGGALAGRSPTLVAGVGAALALGLVAAALRWPAGATYGPIGWAVAMLVAGYVLGSAAGPNRTLVVTAAALALCEVAIVAAIATFFSSFSTPILTTFFTGSMFILGRSADSLTRLPVKFFGQPLHDAGVALSKVVPNLHVYVPARPLLTGEVVDVSLPSYVAFAAVQALGWVVGLLAVASFIFRRRDFL